MTKNRELLIFHIFLNIILGLQTIYGKLQFVTYHSNNILDLCYRCFDIAMNKRMCWLAIGRSNSRIKPMTSAFNLVHLT